MIIMIVIVGHATGTQMFQLRTTPLCLAQQVYFPVLLMMIMS